MKEGKKEVGEGIGIAGFTLGVISIILAGGMGLVLSIVGLIFCLVQQKNQPTKLGKAGIILNFIGLILSAVFLMVFFGVI